MALLALGSAAAVVAAVSPPVRAAGIDAAKKVWGYPAYRRRAAIRSEEAPGSKLAASQVGYGPSMRKEFTSPLPFPSFEVVRDADGVAVLRGGPGRALATEGPGSLGTVWIGDFSELAEPGRYRIEAAGLSSWPFEVGPRVFDAAVRAVQRALYYQRAFTAIDAAHAEGPWVHASDAAAAPPGESGGWHDAGDFSLYNASATSTLFWLLSTYDDFAPPADDTNIPESGNGIPDLLDEVRWGLTWLLAVQEASGGFRDVTCLATYGPYGTNAPETSPAYTPGVVGTLATGRATAILAHASVVLRAFDPAFADRCLAAALHGYRWLKDHPGEAATSPACPALSQDLDRNAGRDVLMFAAAGLLGATGEPSYAADFDANYQEIDNDSSYLRSNVYAAQLYLRAPAGDAGRKANLREKLAEQARAVRADGAVHPFGWATRHLWGSINAGFHRTGSFSAPGCLVDPVANRADCDQALANVHHALGRNYGRLCFVSGLPGVSRGRQHGFHHWLATLQATPFLFPGLVAGGPMDDPPAGDTSYPHLSPLPIWGYRGDPAFPRDDRTPLEGRYTDNDSWSTNELDVEWQAITLYHLTLARSLGRQSPGVKG